MRLVLLALLLGTTGWLYTRVVVSFVDPAQAEAAVDYIVVTGSKVQIALWVASALALIAGGLAAESRRRGSRWTDGLAKPAIGRLAPLLLLAFPLAAVTLLATPARAIAAPWVYLFVDLRWWYLGAVAVLLWLGSENRPTWRPRWAGTNVPPVLLWKAATVVTLMTGALAFGPRDRFDAAVVGDEPKYVRYLENWYRGRGTDIENLAPIQTLPVDYRPQIGHNFTRLGHGLALLAGDLAADARRLVGLPAPPRPGPARAHGEAFIAGKRGGVYQVHNPGLSLLLFPGYFLDRFALTWSAHPFAQGPAYLYATNVTMLLLYLLWGAALFQLLVDHTGKAPLSWSIASIVLLSLPAAAFSYQYYPEVAGGLVLVVVGRYVALTTRHDVRPAFAYGLLAGFLPWLHVRFGYAALVAVGVMAAGRMRTSPRAIAAFVAGVALPIGLLCLYSYHITGSLLPYKVWSVMMADAPSSQVVHPEFVRRLIGLWLDYNWGLIPHAPVFILALAGAWPMWRRSPRLAVFVALTVCPLLVEAAAHNWHGSGTAPLRIVTAVIPLLALPLAAAIEHHRSRWFVAAFSILAVIAVDNGLMFNEHFTRGRPVLAGPTVSGWLSRLCFPRLDEAGWFLNPLVLFWCGTSLLVAAWPVLRRHREPQAGAPPRVSWTLAAAAALAGILAGATAIGTLTGVPKRNDFLRPYREARDIALQFHVSDPASSVWSATHGWIRPERAFPNPRDLEIALDNRTPVALVDEPAVLTISARAPDHMSGWATVVVDFGDGRRSSPLGFVDTRTFHHTYVRPGVYKASTIVSVPGVGEVRRETEVKAIPPDLIGPYGVGRIQGLPNDVMRLPVSISLDRVTFRESAVYLECSRASRVDASSQYWVWLVGYERGALRARLHVAQPSPNADDSRRFSLSIAPGSPPDAGKHATILVGVVPAPGGGAKSRSLDLSFRWPGSELLAGSPVVVAAGPLE